MTDNSGTTAGKWMRRRNRRTSRESLALSHTLPTFLPWLYLFVKYFTLNKLILVGKWFWRLNTTTLYGDERAFKQGKHAWGRSVSCPGPSAFGLICITLSTKRFGNWKRAKSWKRNLFCYTLFGAESIQELWKWVKVIQRNPPQSNHPWIASIHLYHGTERAVNPVRRTHGTWIKIASKINFFYSFCLAQFVCWIQTYNPN